MEPCRWIRNSVAVIALGMVVIAASTIFSREQSAAAQSAPAPWTAEQDHANMMQQLGITALRPGPSGDESAPNHANYDESLANPYPKMPDPLVMDNGQPVTTAAQWWHERRPQLLREFSEDVYGKVPADVPAVHWHVMGVDHERIGFRPVTATDLIGEVDHSGDPAITVKIHMTLVTPAGAKGPVPVLMMFGPAGFPSPHEPSPEEFAKLNAAMKTMMTAQNPALGQVFADHPAWEPLHATPFRFPQLNADGGFPNTWQLIADGWGYVLIDPASIQADNGAGIRSGIIGLVNKGQPRKPDDWGALRAWAWGAAQGLNYLETLPTVDAKHVGIEGVSRYGKAALVTMAYDQRFAMVLVGSSGKGGATLLRRNFGEAVESLTSGEYYWMAGNFMKYGASKAKFGSRNPGDIPVDSNELITLCAPRLTFISYGNPAKGDAKWLDQKGSFMATMDANRVFTLLGAKGMTMDGKPYSGPMPPINTGILDGQLAWRQHDGGHTDAPNMKYFIEWADKWIGHTATQ